MCRNKKTRPPVWLPTRDSCSGVAARASNKHGDVRPRGAILAEIVRVGAPGCLNNVLTNVTVVALTGCVGEGRTDRTAELTDTAIDDVDVTVEPSTAAPTVTLG